MSITVGNIVSGITALTLNNNGDTVIFVEGHEDATAYQAPSGVTYGGVAMHRISLAEDSGDQRGNSGWILTVGQGAPTGSNAFAITYADTGLGPTFIAAAFSGVSQSTPTDVFRFFEGTGTAATVSTIVPNPTGLVLGMCSSQSAITAAGTQTNIATVTNLTSDSLSFDYIPGSTADATFNWTIGGFQPWSATAINLLPSIVARPALYNPYYPKPPIGAPEVYPNLSRTTLVPPPPSRLPLLGHTQDWPDTPRFNPEVTAFMLVTTVNQPAVVSINTTRPALYNPFYGKSPVGAPEVYPNLLLSTLAPLSPLTPNVLPLHQSAPQIIQRPQVDIYPNLLQNTLVPVGTPKFRQLSDSAPVIVQRPQVDVYPNLAQSTLTPSAALTRPPLVFWPQQRVQAPQVDRYPNLLITTLVPTGTPAKRQLSDSAPPIIQRPQVDLYPNLTITTFRSFSPLTAGTLSTSAPYKAPPPGIDFYPNLLESTLRPPGTPKFQTLDVSAPRVWIPPQVDVYPPLTTTTLFPVPSLLSVGRIDASAPYKAPALGVQPAPPNLLENTLQPLPAALIGRRWDWPATIVIKRPIVDLYPNLLDSTLKPAGTPVRTPPSFDRAPSIVGPPQVDFYPNLLQTTLVPPPAPPGQLPTVPIGRYLTIPAMRVELSTGKMYVALSKPSMYVSFTHAGYIA